MDDTSYPNFLWGNIPVEDNADIVARQVVQNGNKRKDIGMFKFRNFGAEAEVEVWPLTENDMKGLGLTAQDAPQETGVQ